MHTCTLAGHPHTTSAAEDSSTEGGGAGGRASAIGEDEDNGGGGGGSVTRSRLSPGSGLPGAGGAKSCG